MFAAIAADRLDWTPGSGLPAHLLYVYRSVSPGGGRVAERHRRLRNGRGIDLGSAAQRVRSSGALAPGLPPFICCSSLGSWKLPCSGVTRPAIPAAAGMSVCRRVLQLFRTGRFTRSCWRPARSEASGAAGRHEPVSELLTDSTVESSMSATSLAW